MCQQLRRDRMLFMRREGGGGMGDGSSYDTSSIQPEYYIFVICTALVFHV